MQTKIIILAATLNACFSSLCIKEDVAVGEFGKGGTMTFQNILLLQGFWMSWQSKVDKSTGLDEMCSSLLWEASKEILTSLAIDEVPRFRRIAIVESLCKKGSMEITIL